MFVVFLLLKDGSSQHFTSAVPISYQNQARGILEIFGGAAINRSLDYLLFVLELATRILDSLASALGGV